MIVCSCNLITKNEIVDVVRNFLRDDEWQLITVGMVYNTMAKRGKCCGCFPNAINIIVETSQAWHRERKHDDSVILPFVTRIRDEHIRCETTRRLARMMSKAHLAA